ncbi:C40 family peptidase [candidate division FCPU426 bacterium]|nr:C40 family peptidase [candidate division FCPU426 bacterium]
MIHTSLRLWLVGFCSMGLLGLSCATMPQRLPDAEHARQVVATAKTLEGKPYRYGGATPEGFDCSGFVQYVFRTAVNKRLPRTSRAQFAYARPIRRGEEQPSDLLFFNVNGRGISHVGIYLGKGLFIHSPKNGGKVKISNANDKYWRRRFQGVRRVL